jgi:ADP-heptose:LPS heptosyltransferase
MTSHPEQALNQENIDRILVSLGANARSDVLIRYSGELLEPGAHIVVLGSCKVGNFIVSTPVLNGLKARFPDATIGFIGSDVTADFEAAHSAIDWRLSWDSDQPGAGLSLFRHLQQNIDVFGPVALAVNLDGFNPVTCALVPWLRPRFVAGGTLAINLRRSLPWGSLPQQRFLADGDWDSHAFLERYQPIFQSNYIAELFCQLAFVADYVDPRTINLPQERPPFDVPDLLIHCTTARAAKVWSFERWREVINHATQRGFSVGLVGSPPAAQRDSYNAGEGEDWLLETTALIDLRGRTSLIQLAGACAEAQAVISVDAGPLHIAAAVGTPTLAIVGNDRDGTGASPIRLWLPRVAVLQRTISSSSCSVCAKERFRNDNCLVDGHPCMSGVDVEQVTGWLDQRLNCLS